MGGGGGLLSAFKRKKKNKKAAGSFPSADGNGDDNGDAHRPNEQHPHPDQHRASTSTRSTLLTANSITTTTAVATNTTTTAAAAAATPPKTPQQQQQQLSQSKGNFHPVAVTCGSFFSNPFHLRHHHAHITNTNADDGSQQPRYVVPPPSGSAHRSSHIVGAQDSSTAMMDAAAPSSDPPSSGAEGVENSSSPYNEERPKSPRPLLTNVTDDSSTSEENAECDLTPTKSNRSSAGPVSVDSPPKSPSTIMTSSSSTPTPTALTPTSSNRSMDARWTSTPTSTYTRSPMIRGKAVASRAALFEAHNSPALSSPSRQIRSPPHSSSSNQNNKNRLSSSTRDFWENVFHKNSSMLDSSKDDDDDDDDDDGEDLVPLKVLKKKQWLQQAFTPHGGGNMPEEDEYYEQEYVLDFSDTCPEMTETEYSEQSTTTFHSPISSPRKLRQQQEQPRSPPMTVDDDQWRAAYEFWYSKGLIPWKPEEKLQQCTLQNFEECKDDGEEEERERSERVVAVLSSLMQSRNLHMTKTKECPLLTLFGGDGDRSGGGNASVHVVVATPSSLACASLDEGEDEPSKMTTTPTPRSLAYSNYVQAYKAYVHDRSDQSKALAYSEARRVLDLAKQDAASAPAAAATAPTAKTTPTITVV